MEQQQSIQWRMDKVQELSSQGNSQREISKIFQVGIGTVNRDLSYLRQQAKSNIRGYIDERQPEEYEKCLVGLNAILREAWNTSQHTEDRREMASNESLYIIMLYNNLLSLENMEALEYAGRYREAIQVGLDILDFNENNSRVFQKIMYCLNQLGQYRATIAICDYALNNGYAREWEVNYFRNFAIQKLRGANPGTGKPYGQDDDTVDPNDPELGRFLPKGYIRKIIERFD
jgi:tetratricopeptide (TPR) repeat protein